MAFGQTALCKLAVKLESKETKAIGLDPVLTLSLKAWLLEVYEFLLPRPSDYEQRKTLVAAFNRIAAESFGNNNGFPVVEAFGSFVMDMFTAGSDLDLSINFSSDYNTEYPRSKKISDLRRFLGFLYKHKRKGYISEIQPVLRARVPVIKVVDSATGIECDVSAENKDGVTRTSTFKYVSLIDERFRILSFLMKVWAKAHDINSSKDRTMNSLSIISLVAFHLQTRDPPIMPPFSALFKDGIDVSSIQNAVVGFEHFGSKNKESIAQLFISLLIKLSAVESLWEKGLCASTYEGTWIKKEWGAGGSIMSVEDFLDRSENFARAVGKAEIKIIYNCIKSSLQLLSSFMKGQVPEAKLKAQLFGFVPMNFPIDHFIKKEQRGPKRSNPFDESVAPNGITEKRTRYTEAIEEVRHDFHSVPTNFPSASFHLPPTDLPSTSFQLRPPAFPCQPSHRNPSRYQSVYGQHASVFPISQPEYRNQYRPTLPSAPHLDYVSQYHPRLLSPPHLDYSSQYNFQQLNARTSGFQPEYHPQVPFSPQLGHRIEQQPPVQFRFSSTHEYLPNQNLNFHRSREDLPENYLPSYSTLGLGHPQQPYVPPRQAYGPDFNDLHPYH